MKKCCLVWILLFLGCLKLIGSEATNFSYGWYDRVSAPSDVTQLKTSGANFIIPYTETQTDQAILNYLNKAAQEGIGVLVELRRSYIANEDYAAISDFVEKFDLHPAVKGWYSADEPGLQVGWTPAVMENVYNAIKSRSDKLVYIVFSYVEVDRGDVQAYNDSFDVFLIDHYPYRIDPVSTASELAYWKDLVDRTNAISQQIGKPWWNCLQTIGAVPRFSWPFRLPSYEEIRLQLYWSLVNDAQGVAFFAYYLANETPAYPSGPYPGEGEDWVFDVYEPVIQELESILDVIDQGITSSGLIVSDSRLSAYLYEDSGSDTFVLVAANSTATAYNVDIEIPSGDWLWEPVGSYDQSQITFSNGGNITLSMPADGTFIARVVSKESLALISVLPPSEGLIVANESNIAGVSLADWMALTGTTANQWRDYGQSFQAPADAWMKSIALEIWDASVQAPNAEYTLIVYESAIGGSDIGEIITIREGFLPPEGWISTANGKYLNLGFSSPVHLYKDKYYTVMLHFNERGTGTPGSPGSDRRIRFAGSASGTISGWGGIDPRIFQHNSPFSGKPTLAYASTPTYALKLYVTGDIIAEASLMNTTFISDDPPAQNVIVGNSATSAGAAIAEWLALTGTTNAQWRDAGQSFQAPETTLWESFALKMFDVGAKAPGSDYMVQIYESSVGGSNIGTLVALRYGRLPEGTWNTTAAGKYLNIQFSEAIWIEEGHYYTAILHFLERGDGTPGNPTTDRRIRFSGTGATTVEGWAGEDPRIFRQDAPFTSGPVLTYPTQPIYALNFYAMGDATYAVNLDNVETYAFVTTAEAGTETVQLSGTVELFLETGRNGETYQIDNQGRDQVSVSVSNISFNSNDSALAIIWDESKPSGGIITEGINNTAGRLDVAPFAEGQGLLQLSFFVRIEYKGQTYYLAQPLVFSEALSDIDQIGRLFPLQTNSAFGLLDNEQNPTGLSVVFDSPLSPTSSWPPELKIAQRENDVYEIRWTSTSPLWTLESASTLGGDADWEVIPGPYVPLGGDFLVEAEVSESTRFFRLKRTPLAD